MSAPATWADRREVEGDAPAPSVDRHPWDQVLAAILAASALAVHDVGYMLSHPFWVDEAWVAVTTRARVGLLPWLSATTPVGWMWLVRVVPGTGAQRLRMLPLAFTVGAVAAGYWFGRELRIMRYLGGLLSGMAVLLVPAMLVRDVLVLVARIENHWSRARLVTIAAVTAGGLFFTNTVIFVGVAAMAALGVETLVRRRPGRLLDVAVASAGMLAASGAVYELVDRRHVVPGLTAFWAAYFIPRDQGLSGAVTFVHQRAAQLAPDLGFRSLTVDGILALSGVAGLIWLKRYALAVIVPITLALVLAASAAKIYPFGDLRTSTFWLVMVAVLMAVGVATAVRVVATLNPPTALLLAAGALAVWVWAAHPYVRSHPIADEDVRSQVAYLDQHRQPGDVVIVNSSASFAFAYYDRRVTPDFEHYDGTTTGFLPVYPGVPWLIQMRNRQAADVSAALATAVADVGRQPAGNKGRIWIVRSHVSTGEMSLWQAALAGRDTTEIPVGPEPLTLYRPS